MKTTILGKEAKLGLAFLESVSKGEALSVADIFKKFESDTLFFVPKLMAYALRAGGNDVTNDEVFDWVDENGISHPDVITFANAFAKSMEVHIPKEEGKPKATRAKK